jgi:ELWxxDGT repeat protein
MAIQTVLSNSWSVAVRRLLGSGGMGVVYEAWDERLQRRVALKVLHAHLTAEPSHRDRLLQEARLAARVEHPNVVRIYAVHDSGDSLAIEMEYIEGTPLHLLLAGRQVTPGQAAELLRQVLEALAACHERGVVHGDLKPANLMVTWEGRVILTDFGIARAVLYDEGAGTAHVSLSGPIWATPQYCPPEAWEGAHPSPAWDLYAAGVMAHEALAGALPFAAQTPAVLMREKLERDHTPIAQACAEVSPELAQLIDSLKARLPEDRPSSARSAIAELLKAPESHMSGVNTQPFQHTPKPRGAEGERTNFHVSLPRRVTAEPPQRPGSAFRKPHVRAAALGVTLLLIPMASLPFVRQQESPPDTSITVGTPPAGEIGEILHFKVVGDYALFSYDDGRRGRELWYAKSDGKADIVADINPGPASSNPAHLLGRNDDAVVFAATSEEFGREPWFCTLREEYHSTWMLKDAFAGSGSSDPVPVATWDQAILFQATTLAQGRELWVSNSKTEQTGLLVNLDGGDGNSLPPYHRALPDETGAFFVANSGTWWLWRYDLASGEVRQLVPAHEDPGEMILLGEKLLLAMPSEEFGCELWEYSEGMQELRLVRDVYPGPESSNPQQFFVWQGHVYFQATHPESGAELWRTDGTPDGTTLFADMEHGMRDSAPYGFVDAGDQFFFRAHRNATGHELWMTDGTCDGTRLAVDLLPGTDSSRPYNLAIVGGYLFFTADDGATGEELWKFDPTEPEAFPLLVADLWPGDIGSEPHALQLTGANTGVFVYKTELGENLMRLEVTDHEVKLTPFTGLPRFGKTKP